MLFGALAPDFDMLWFHLVDAGRTHHHFYPTHWRLFWVGTCLPIAATTATFGRLGTARATLGFLAGTLLHLVLDSIAAPIHWLMPFDPVAVELVEVPARFDHWVVSFVLHWTFALELAIWLAAALVFLRARTA